MKIYISGVISQGGTLREAQQLENAKRFRVTAQYILRLGHEPVNPIERHGLGAVLAWSDYMKRNLADLISSDAIYLLYDWHLSRGARLEFTLANELGMHIFFESEGIT